MYTLKMVITELNQTKGFLYKANWYSRDSKHCPLHTQINNTQDIKKAKRFKTKEEAEKHKERYFKNGSYEVVKI